MQQLPQQRVCQVPNVRLLCNRPKSVWSSDTFAMRLAIGRFGVGGNPEYVKKKMKKDKMKKERLKQAMREADSRFGSVDL